MNNLQDMKQRTISQQQIARDLGYSQALVSFVLNGKRENISEESYQRIWNYARKKGYRPKGMQAHGSPMATRNVGFILRAGLRLFTQSNFFSHVQHGLHSALQEKDYNSVFLGAEDHLGGQKLKNKLLRDNLAGVVVMGEVSSDFLEIIRSVQPNIVAVSASYPGLCHSVMPNERQAMQQLVDHLIRHGHRSFAWIGGNQKLQQNSTRRGALVEALAQHGLHLPDPQSADVVDGDRLGGRKAAEMILESCPARSLASAWVCHNALMARGAMNLFAQKGWAVPGKFSVVAVDATRVCEEEHPQITGSNADPDKMGAKVAEILLQSLAQTDGSLCDVVLPAQLTVRESSGPAA
jgi:LacI family transcriptional regulator